MTETEELSYELKIPQERVAVLIGEHGATKKEIEKATQTEISVSPEGDVILMGTDGLLLYTTQEIVRAIGRGFNPKIAMQLLKTDYALELIDMKDIAGKSKNTLERIKGRIIGTRGRARREIEHLTNTHISVYGKTVAIIGETADVALARQALAMLLQGSMHKTVYHFLERKRKEMAFG